MRNIDKDEVEAIAKDFKLVEYPRKWFILAIVGAALLICGLLSWTIPYDDSPTIYDVGTSSLIYVVGNKVIVDGVKLEPIEKAHQPATLPYSVVVGVIGLFLFGRYMIVMEKLRDRAIGAFVEHWETTGELPPRGWRYQPATPGKAQGKGQEGD